MSVLVCGGAGYIGTHACVELINSGYEIIVVDNLSNSSREAINRVECITGATITFEEIDLCDMDKVVALFKKYSNIEAVIHFAGYKAVDESRKLPIKYYRNNLISTINILQAMQNNNVHNLVFSSSATVYGDVNCVPINELCDVGGTTNPYGTTKFFIEQIIKDCCAANSNFNAVILRYFNPIGAHETGLIGEDPKGVPNNLIPYIAKVAIGEFETLHVYGDDYPTLDGTGVRDYIHVVDLAKAHVAALDRMKHQSGLFIYNIGTGRGYSVMEILHAYEDVCGKKIPYVIEPRRPGDIAICYADCTKANDELNWKAQLDIKDMCASSWKWQQQNPKGYKE